MTDIKTMNEQYKQYKKFTNTLFQQKKKKEILKLKNGRKSALKPPFIDTTVTNSLCYKFSSVYS